MLPRGRQSLNIWPGFVDGLASVLMVLLFTLMIFVTAQFFLSYIAANREGALAQLSENVHQLFDELSIEQAKVGELETDLATALGVARDSEARAEAAERERDSLNFQRTSLQSERDTLAAQQAALAARQDALTARRDALESERDALADQLSNSERAALADAAALATSREELAALREEIVVNEAGIKTRLEEIAGMQADISTLRTVRAELEAKVGDLEAQLTTRDDTLTAERDRSKALQATLADMEERTRLAQVDVEERDRRIQDLATQIAENESALAGERTLTTDERNRVRVLTRQVDGLVNEIRRLSNALSLSESEAGDFKAEAEDLGARLNTALARKVEELQRYRSDFFGRLSEVLGTRADVRIIGDRFLFQSELLFPSGSADLEPAGREQLARLAATLKDVAKDIPEDVDWLLRVDGHTDRVPIRSAQFPSNWELSAARALSVVRFLVDEGIPARRLAAAGFGQFRPLDTGTTADAYAKNRRIELKLTGP